MMTEAEAEAYVERIRYEASVNQDPEVAHSLEDKLRSEVLLTITQIDNMQHARRLAEIALSTEGYDFPRWCA